MNNKDIRMSIRTTGLFYWQVADKLGITDGNFSRMLRKELNKEQRGKVYKAIEEAESHYVKESLKNN